ncbi:MAG: hypothetical protein M3O62_18940, partial [Pseudomonadota bacterium]|nr:hypothetical protein [Pseudomonadota bacterium]
MKNPILSPLRQSPLDGGSGVIESRLASIVPVRSIRKLSALDSLFLLLERRHAPFHVGALSLFRPPEGSPKDFVAQLVARLNRRPLAAAPFDRRLVTRNGLNYWESDPEFEIDQHFIHLALPSPAQLTDLPAMVSRIHSALLDRAYPLWRIYLIEGLDDGRVAIYSKIHHSVVDGVAAIRLMLKSMSPDPNTSAQMPPPWQVKALQGTRPGAQVSAKERLTQLMG